MVLVGYWKCLISPPAFWICKRAFCLPFILRLNEQAVFVEEDILGMLLKMK